MSDSGTLTCDVESPDVEGSAPRAIGRYVIGERLGAGGMGVVWSARDPDLDRRVAIKVLRAGGGSESDRRGQLRLVREAQALAKLSHPNVVQVYDAGVQGAEVYVAMEFVAGMTVAQWLEAESRSWREVVRLFVEAGRGLAAAHTAGLVHRDFKPSNVLVSDDGRVRVADFGLASAPSHDAVDRALGGLSATVASGELTSQGSIIGTPRYMAPEQRQGLAAGPAADQFSFCVALHEALFRARPYPQASRGRGPLHASDYVAPRDTLGIPRVVVDAVRRGLRIEPEQRFPELSDLLERIAPAPGQLARRLRWGTMGLAAVGIGVGAWSIGTEAPACDTAQAAMAEVWSDTRRDGLAARLQTADADVVLAGVDRYAQRWAEAGDAACRAHRDGLRSDAQRTASATCFEDRRQALMRFVGLLEDAKPSTLEHAAVAASRLPRIDDCEDPSAAVADPELQHTVEDLRRRTLLATVSHHAGHVDTALGELEAVEAEALATAHEPLVAETSLALGRLAMDRQDWKAAQPQLVRASASALASGSDRIAAEAEARLLFVDPQLADDPSRALERERIAVSLTQRAGDPAWLRALVRNNVGVAHALGGDRDQAAENFARAVELAASDSEGNPLDRAGYAMNAALLTADVARRDALFETSVGGIEQALGRGHYQWLDHVATWAEYTPDAARALARLEPICPQLQGRANDDPMRGYLCFLRQALLHDALGQAQHAHEAAQKAVDALAEAREQPLLSFRTKAQAYAAYYRGDDEAVLRHYTEADTALRPRAEMPWVASSLAELEALRARALHRLGRVDEAQAQARDAFAGLEKAAALTEDRGPHLVRASLQATLDA